MELLGPRDRQGIEFIEQPAVGESSESAAIAPAATRTLVGRPESFDKSIVPADFSIPSCSRINRSILARIHKGLISHCPSDKSAG